MVGHAHHHSQNWWNAQKSLIFGVPEIHRISEHIDVLKMLDRYFVNYKFLNAFL